MSDALIGFGASAIGQLPQGYVQNAVATGVYQTMIGETGLAAVRGVQLSLDDRVRAAAIERLMCTFDFSAKDLAERFGASGAAAVIADAEALVDSDQDGLVKATADGFEMTEFGKPFVRTICACFDVYLGQGKAQHALAV